MKQELVITGSGDNYSIVFSIRDGETILASDVRTEMTAKQMLEALASAHTAIINNVSNGE
jgi:hypothetical protein